MPLLDDRGWNGVSGIGIKAEPITILRVRAGSLLKTISNACELNANTIPCKLLSGLEVGTFSRQVTWDTSLL
jgi:hypothetical protein